MKFSFLLCTLDNPELLYNSVRSILAQSYRNFEIIIVDQSLSDCASIALLSPKIKYIHVPHIRGLSKARNIGIQYLSGDFTCFMDDDAMYDIDGLSSVRDICSEYAIVSGIILDIIDRKTPYIKGYANRKKEITKLNIFKLVSSAALIIKTDVLRSLMLDDDFGVGAEYGSGEETDLVLRALYLKTRAVYTPKFKVYHPTVSKINSDILKTAKYNVGFGALCAKHIQQYKNYYMLYIFIKGILKNIIGYLLYLFINKKMRNYYKVCLESKIYGFVEYISSSTKK